MEIIIVDDGSTKDRTAEIADRFAARYPGIIKAVHQENGGHGEAVNAGLRNATGEYFKVVDSDDWVNREAYMKILETLEQLTNAGEEIDMMVSNFVYEKEGARHKKVMQYRRAFPQGKIFGWDEMKRLKLGQYILMHSVIYRTEMLRASGLELPKHTFYVDNLFVYHPFPYVQKLYYLDVNFYRYYIGREGQSVNEQTMIRRLDQQIRVNKLMIQDWDLTEIPCKKLSRYMYSYLEIMTTISSIMAIRSHEPEKLAQKDELWKYFREANPKMYRRARWSVTGIAMHLPGRGGRKIAEIIYHITQLIYGFN